MTPDRWLLVALVLVPAVAAGQGLGDASSRERTRRAKQAQQEKAPVRQLTNDDLEKGRPPAPKAAAAEESASAPAQGAEATPPPVEDRASVERPYLDAVMQAQNRVAEIERRITELSARLDPHSPTYVSGPQGSNSSGEELDVRSQLTAAETELREARADLGRANQDFQNARERTSKPQ